MLSVIMVNASGYSEFDNHKLGLGLLCPNLSATGTVPLNLKSNHYYVYLQFQFSLENLFLIIDFVQKIHSSLITKSAVLAR
jgi:hypothetical protein